jgi:hypothetical protein
MRVRGVHVGELRCVGDTCNQKIAFEPLSPGPGTEPLVFEYKFKSRVAFDPDAERGFVSGTGTISGAGPKVRFSFRGECALWFWVNPVFGNF